MDELKIVKLAELRAKLSAIVPKLIVTFLFTAGVMWRFSIDKFLEDVGSNIFLIITMYGIISYFWIFVRATGNWLIGIVVAFVLIFVWAGSERYLGNIANTVIGFAIIFGGTVLDVINIVRYFLLRRSVFSADGAAGYYEQDYVQYGDDDDASEDGASYREQSKTESSPGFFSGCKDQSSVKRRYRDLCRVYHPDNGNGSEEVFSRITDEYNSLMEQYK